MATILFGYRNLALEADNVYSGDEAGDFVDDNLQKIHPTQWWRADDLTGSHCTFRFDNTTQLPVALVALLYSTAGRFRNLLGSSNDLSDTTYWSLTNATLTRATGVASPEPGSAVFQLLSSGAGSVQHFILQTLDMARTDTHLEDATIQHGVHIYAKRDAGSANIELEIGFNNLAETASIEVDLSDGSVNTTNASANVTIDSSSVTDKGSGWYQIKLTATAAMAAADGRWKYSLKPWILDSSFNRIYTQAGEQISVTVPRLVYGTADGVWEVTSDPGGRWKYSARTAVPASSDPTATPDYESGWLHVGMSANMEPWEKARGWAHSWHVIAAADQANYAGHLIEHYCDNASGTVDLSNVYLGPYFQPARNYVEVSMTPAAAQPVTNEAPGGQEFAAATPGPRLFDLRFSYISEANAKAGFEEMALILQAHSPLVVILDSDDQTYGQSGCVYGRLSRAVQMSSGPDHYIKSAAYTGAAWSVSLQIRERFK